MTAISKDIGSPLANILAWKELTLFTQAETAQLVNEPTNYQIAPTISERIFNQTGGHPFLIQYLMHFLCEFDLNEAEGKLDSAVLQFLEDHRTQFHNWWEKFSPEERQVYAFLTRQQGTVPKREIVRLVGDTAANNALSVLCHTGVVARVQQQEDYQVAGLMFKEWFAQYGRFDLSPSGYDSKIESKLRDVDPLLAERYLSAWAILGVELPKYSGAVSEVRDVLTQVLHKLAPDEEVKKQPNYQPERDSHGNPLPTPTRRQRTQYILQQREGTLKVRLLEKEIALLDTLLEQLSASVALAYDHASSRTHTGATYEQAWRCLKQLDSVLAQLL
jgi:hypothetical protein